MLSNIRAPTSPSSVNHHEHLFYRTPTSGCFRKSQGSGFATSLANKSANEPNHQLPNELHEPPIRKFLKKKSFFIF